MNKIIIRSYIKMMSFMHDLEERVNADDPGMATAEYAIVLVAATSFAAVLVAILKSEAVRSLLTKIITGALNVAV